MSFFIVFLSFLIPGYFITLFSPRIRGFSERIGFSIAISISLEVVISVFFVVFHFPLREAFFLWNIAISFFLIIALRKKIFFIFKEWKDTHIKEKIFISAAFFISILAGIFVSKIHFGYPWAIHADEWWQVGITQNVLEGGSLNTNPYLFNDFLNHKPGFGSFVAMLLSILKKDPLDTWGYMPAVNVFLVSFVGSLFIFSRTKGFLSGVLFPVFLVALRSNAYSLGWWFFVPSTFSLFFVLVIFLTAPLWTKHLSEFFLASLFLSALGVIYLPFAVLLSFLFFPLIFKNIKRKTVRLFTIIAISFLIFIGAYIAQFISPYNEFWRTIRDFSFIPFFLESKVIHAFFVPISATFHFVRGIGFFYTVPVLFFVAALIGFFLTRKDEWTKGIRIGFLVGVALILFGEFTGVSFLVFYQRLFYFTGVIVAMFATVGVVEGVKKTVLFLASLQFPILWRNAIGFFLVGIFFLFIFNKYFILPNGAHLYKLVNKDDLTALLWLKENNEKFHGMAVVANGAVGTIVTPFTRLSSKVSFLTSQNMGAVINSAELMVEEEKDCERKEAALVSLGAKILYAKKPQECPFLKLIYQNPTVFIYLYEAGEEKH